MTLQALATTAASSPNSGHSKSSREYLSFRLGQEEYGIDILQVQEIRSYEVPTRMANAPEFIKGVINLRGVIVPIVDLRLKLNCGAAEYSDFTVVIVLNVKNRVIGVVVDAVSDVVPVKPSQVKAAPQFETSLDAQFIMGLADVGGRMLILMDIESVVGGAGLGLG